MISAKLGYCIDFSQSANSLYIWDCVTILKHEQVNQSDIKLATHILNEGSSCAIM